MDLYSPPSLTIVICTRNRAFILPECLTSLAQQRISPGLFEVLIVDNASTDETAVIATVFCAHHANFHYVLEPKAGLSHARNRGWRTAETDWIGYLDDDARVPSNFVERVLWVIEHYDFDCFGGGYVPWYPFGKPKWQTDSFGHKPPLTDSVRAFEEGFLAGGIFFIKKDWFNKVDGFNPNLGMGMKMGYAEEDELQRRVRAAGGRIGFDPELIMEHAVLPEKLRVRWHLQMAFTKGRDGQAAMQQRTLAINLWCVGRTLIALILKKAPLHLLYWLWSGKRYYWQNFIIDTLSPFLNCLGRVWGHFAYRFK